MVWLWILIGVVAFIAVSLVGMLFAVRPIAKKIYNEMLVRSSDKIWGRENSCPENEEHSRMYDTGIAWSEEYKDSMTEVETENDGLKLYGEFYDFGGDSAVIIVPGRAESLKYSYYFARPYSEAGVSVLVIDTRAHGISEGKFTTCGVRESEDTLKWAKLIREQFGVKKVMIHGICIGGCTAVLAAGKDEEGVINGVAAEGLFPTFFSIFSQRTKNSGHPAFPVVEIIRSMMKKSTGVDMKKDAAPVKVVGKLEIPVLLMYSRKDIAVRAKAANKVIAAAGDKAKVVWFENGGHSHIRINDTEKYDATVAEFIKEI